jgi:MFS family permease
MLLVAGIFYTIAAALRIWMATTMSSSTERVPEKLTVASLKSSVKLMFSMLFAGGLITWIFLTDGVGDIAFRLSGELQPIYFEKIAGLTIQQIGLLGSVFSFSIMFTPLLSGKISDRYGERVPIAMGFLLVFAGFAVFLNVGSFIGFAAAWVIAGAGVGLLDPAYQSLISKAVPQKNLGIFTGLFRSSLGLISLPAPYIGAMLWERFNPRLPFIITAAATLLMIIPIWLKFKLPDKENPAEPPELAETAPLTTE